MLEVDIVDGVSWKELSGKVEGVAPSRHITGRRLDRF